MPRWTTVFSAPYRGTRSYAATSGGRRFRVQMHPADESRMLIRLAHAAKGERFKIEAGATIEVVYGKTSHASLVAQHVQHVPSWKGNIHTAVVSF